MLMSPATFILANADIVWAPLQALLSSRVPAERSNPQRTRHSVREVGRAAHNEARVLDRGQCLQGHMPWAVSPLPALDMFRSALDNCTAQSPLEVCGQRQARPSITREAGTQCELQPLLFQPTLL